MDTVYNFYIFFFLDLKLKSVTKSSLKFQIVVASLKKNEENFVASQKNKKKINGRVICVVDRERFDACEKRSFPAHKMRVDGNKLDTVLCVRESARGTRVFESQTISLRKGIRKQSIRVIISIYIFPHKKKPSLRFARYFVNEHSMGGGCHSIRWLKLNN